jgi:hypothetical protein
MPLKTTYYKPSEELIEQLIGYLSLLAGKTLSIICIRQNILKATWSERDMALMYRSQIQAAALYLSFIIEKGDVEANERNIKTVIADILNNVKYFDQDVDTKFILVSPNTQLSRTHFKHASSLFYNNKLPDENNPRYHFDVLVLYALRLAIDKRVLGFLGIDFILIDRTPLPFSKLFPIIKSLTSVEYDPAINWIEIEWVYKWLNHHIHRTFRPNPWTIHQAFQIIEPLYKPGERLSGTQRTLSIYASTFVKDEDLLKEEIEEKIAKTATKAKIYWLHSREIFKPKTI